MSKHDHPVLSPETEQTVAPKRLRRFITRHVPVAIGSIVLLLVLAVIGIYVLMSSARFEGMVRNRLITELEQATGGRVEIAAFHWQLLRLEAEAEGLVLHGLETQGDEPLGRIERLRVRVSLLGLWSPSVRLNELDITQPQVHLIIFPDGSTNLPKPNRPKQSSTRPIDTFFDLKAGHISLEQGFIHIESRRTDFDFQNRTAPLSLQANDFSVLLRYIPGENRAAETYRIETGATDLNLARNVTKDVLRQSPKEVHAYFQATLDLTRASATLQSLRLTARGADKTAHSLNISGALEDFTHPRWQARVLGDLDMRLLDPLTGYPFTPEGIAHLDLNGAGHGGEFNADGKVHAESAAYVGTGVNATGIRLDADVHANEKRLLISSIVARMRQGGQIEGTVDLSPWLGSAPAPATETVSPASAGGRNNRKTAPVPPGTIPVNGKVTANFKDVALDTILDMVSEPPFQRLGIGSLVNGPATAMWVDGDDNTVVVAANLNLRPTPNPRPGELGGTGVVDATYTQRTGAVDVRRLELRLPESELIAHGSLGAYPISSASSLAVDFQTRNLGEFDSVLRSLGLQNNGKSGTAALPVSLGGQADFHGSWTGSLANPRFAGTVSATRVDLEMPDFAAEENAPGQTRTVHLDSVDATGSYSSTHIAVDRGVLQLGNTKLAVSGALTAAPTETPGVHVSNGKISTRASGAPEFDRNSVVNIRLDAAKVKADDLQSFVKLKMPFTGTLDSQLEIDGPLHSPTGSGWVQLDSGTVYDEPVNRVRVQGKMVDQVINMSLISVVSGAGMISGTGSYSLQSKSFQLDARSTGTGIDIAKVEAIRRQDWGAAGRLEFAVHGTGTFDDPQLQGNASLNDLAVGGDPVGALQMNAHTVNHALVYDITTSLDAARLNVHGETTLKPGFATQAKIEFSQFNIGSVLRLTRINQLSGESALAGTVTLEGPLAHPEQLLGEARLQELEATVAGVHLKSEGEVHAILSKEKIQLYPLHVTGEDTDLRTQGTLALNGTRQLDLQARGSVNLKLAQTIDPDLTASGNTTFEVEAHGPLYAPSLQGRIDIDNGAMSFGDLPNGLSQLHGRLVFNQNRLEVRTLTAMSGGGPLSVGGYLSYQHGFYAELSVTGKGVRIRYPQGISSLADATLRVQGSQNSMLLSGDVMITRFSVSPDMDFAMLASQAKVARNSVVSPTSPTNHVRLDVRIHSSPQLNFQNAFAKLAGEVDLRLRGTLAVPSIVGRISVTEGSAVLAGTRYDLQRGDITFTNPVRIEPTIDLSASARVEDYDVTLSVRGTPDKLAVNYRSDPPLPEPDVVSLLALGRTSREQRLFTQQQEQALSNPTTDMLLNGALNATMSNRVQRIFGVGSVKVDPNYLGPFGNSTSRIIVQEQLGRNLTLTYATDVNTTAQQLLQAEIAINRHVSLLVARDESGVFSMVIKATRRYR